MIPDEAVETVAVAWTRLMCGCYDPEDVPHLHDELRTILEAAAPHLMAQALNDAADAFENLPTKEGTPVAPWDRTTAVVRLRERAIRSTQAPTFQAKASPK